MGSEAGSIPRRARGPSMEMLSGEEDVENPEEDIFADI
jgi:hypothetical protein